jgi:hypothetical protein
MVLVFSEHANRSPDVQREVERAFDKRVAVIPFRVQNTAPSDGLEYFLGSVHWLDAVAPPLEKHLESLTVFVKSLLTDREAERVPVSKTTPSDGIKNSAPADSTNDSHVEEIQQRPAREKEQEEKSRLRVRRMVAAAISGLVLSLTFATVLWFSQERKPPSLVPTPGPTATAVPIATVVLTATPGPAATAVPIATAGPTATRINLLAPENGGQVVLATSDAWLQTIDGNEVNETYLKPGDSAVYTFKDERPVTFDTFAVLIPGSGDNLKEFELMAGNDSPTGEFRSIGKFTTVNAKFMKSPYQEFKFVPVTAKYLKVQLLSFYGEGTHRGHAWVSIIYQFRLFGQFKE